MLTLLHLSLNVQSRDLLVHEKLYLNRPQAQAVVKDLIQMQISFLTLFVSKEGCKGKCEQAIETLKPLGEEMRGLMPIVLIDCSRNNSVKFCKEQKIKRFPTLRMQNYDFKYNTPQDYDDDEYEPELVKSWYYEVRRKIFDISPRADALLQVIDEPQQQQQYTLIYTSKGPELPIFMQQFCLLVRIFVKDARQIQQPGFNEDEYDRIANSKLEKYLKPNKDQILLITKDKLELYEGEQSKEALQIWINKIMGFNQDGTKRKDL